jgi:CheY-like chemotaxis protein
MNRVSRSIRTILVVEDYEDVRQMLKILLESEHFRVLEAATGGEALKVLKNGRPDVILMDLALPGFDGFETIRRIRKIDGFQNTPIIVLTAYSGQSMYETAMRAGTNYFMAKPIDFDELAELLEQILVKGNRRNPKYNRPAAQRALISSGASVPHLTMREVRWTFN